MDPIPHYPNPTDPSYPTYPVGPTNVAEFTALVHSQCNPIVLPRASVGCTSSESPDVIRSCMDFISRMASRKSRFLANLNAFFNTAPPSPIMYRSLRLPIEVCELVIEFIKDTRTLRSCCLTCRDWLPRSRIGLYRYTTDSVLKSENIPTFIERLRFRPTSGHSVLNLRVELHDPYGRISKFKPRTSGLSIIAIQFPSQLLNLQKLCLVDPDMRSIHPSSYTALTRFRNVHTLELWRPALSTYNQLCRFVAAFRNLTNLQFELDPMESGLLSLPDGTRRILSRKPAIPHLEIRSCGGHYPALFRWLSPCATSLKIDSSWSSSGDLQAIADYIQRCGSSLRDLVLGRSDQIFGRKASFEPDHFNFAHNTNLRSLRMSLVSNRDAEEYALFYANPDDSDILLARQDKDCDDLQSVARMLATVSSDCLEELEVSLSLYLDPNWELESDKAVLLPEPGVNAIDSALALPNFPHVKRIHICMVIGYLNVFGEDNVSEFSRESMAQLLPQLARRAEADFTPLDIYDSNETDLCFNIRSFGLPLKAGRPPPRACWSLMDPEDIHHQPGNLEL